MAAKQIELLLNGIMDANGDPLGAGKVYTYIAGTTTPLTTYTDITSTTPHTNPIILDARGVALAYVDAVCKLVITDLNDVSIGTYDNLSIGSSTSTAQIINSGDSGGSGNAYTLTNGEPATTYLELDSYRFIANHTNTGASTVNVDGVGSLQINRPDGTALQAGDITVDEYCEIVMVGTLFVDANFILTTGAFSPIEQIKRNSFNLAASSSGSANAFLLTVNYPMTSYETFYEVTFKAIGTNTGATTVNVSNLGVKNIVKTSGAALAAGDIQSGGMYKIIYDGTEFHLVGT